MTTRRTASPWPGSAASTWTPWTGHVTEFAKILTGRHGGRPGEWITAVETDDQPDLHSFARTAAPPSNYLTT